MNRDVNAIAGRLSLRPPQVTAKKEATEKWCGLASAHTAVNGGKPWRYILIPHDTVSENATLEGLESEFRG